MAFASQEHEQKDRPAHQDFIPDKTYIDQLIKECPGNTPCKELAALEQLGWLQLVTGNKIEAAISRCLAKGLVIQKSAPPPDYLQKWHKCLKTEVRKDF